ncbi:MAG TPA: RDD family protein [Acidimicrobiales bacterium]|nr:RDD family protein [Acidimicrobiales bacterium]
MSAADPDQPPESGRGAGRNPPPPFAQGVAETDLLATFGQRIGARLLDGLIIGLPLMIVVFAVSDVSDDRRTISTPLWAQILPAAVFALYEIVLIHSRGQTIGKRIVGVRVVRITDGTLPDWTASVVRYLLPVVPVLVPVPVLNVALSLLIYLVAFVNPLRRGWHDRAAGTIVVKAEAPSPAGPAPPPPSADGEGDV